MERKHHTPYLIQRLTPRIYGADERKGVDRYFAMDYMGSSEFEWGAVPKALRAMRETPGYESWQPRRMKVMAGLPQTKWEPQVAWFVGPTKELYELALDLFQTELRNEYKYRLKEGSRIAQSYGLDEFTARRGMQEKNFYEDIVGWWDIQSTYVFFRKKAQAEQWLKGLRG